MKKFPLLISSSFLLFSALSMANTTQLSEGQMRVIALGQSIKSVFIANPDIADYQVIDKHKVAVFGKQQGKTSLALFGEEGQTLYSSDIVIETTFEGVEKKISKLYPDSKINIENIGDQVVISGTVSSEKIKDQVYVLLGELLKRKSNITEISAQSADLGSNNSLPLDFMQRREYEGIINNVQVVTTKQVNVKLTLAEVSHRFAETLGVKYSTNGKPAGVFVDQLTHFSAKDIVSIIEAKGEDGVGHILAQPNLSVMSGETAKFLVGGELPVVTVVDGSTNVEYKEYGVSLNVAAKVLSDEQIKLTLLPSVSTLDKQYEATDYELPALKTRKAETTVQLADGKSFILGGLMSKEENESVSRIPLLGDIPLLGALFRSSNTERNQSELIIIATVNLVKPVESKEIQLPNIQTTSTLQRLFNIYGTQQTTDNQDDVNRSLNGGFMYE
ncbi:TPA: pilus assembly protein N-terminal domain-containing protein [Vibrio vulnificus]|nr:general secretion pathway protein GspD [Vibrio vulnificus]HDY8012851.1 pilus assembly protein N-terminal domain-containing protein [Vibrio vulnificus]